MDVQITRVRPGGPILTGEVLEWSNRRAWKARRARKALVGSNPTLSAKFGDRKEK